MAKETIVLNEDSRSQLLSQGKKGAFYKTDRTKGKNRYERRTHSLVASNVRQFNDINMNKFFKDDILDVNVSVHGETGNYTVRIIFGGVLNSIRGLMKSKNKDIGLSIVTQALAEAFNRDNVYVRCNCPDAIYRFNYFQSVNDIIAGDPKETRPSKITNPNNTLGSACKHVLLVLSNSRWVMKVGSSVYNYIQYIKKHREDLYAKIIFPALYEREYDASYQLALDDTGELVSDKTTMDVANIAGKQRGQFQKGNEYRFQKQPEKEPKQQTSLLDITNEDDEQSLQND